MRVRAAAALGCLVIGAALTASARVLRPASEEMYLAVVPLTVRVPGIHLLADTALLTLLAIHLSVMWRARTAGPWLRLALSGAAGVLAAFATSEAVKGWFVDERPCRVVLALKSCPTLGDWSFPSNHMAISAGVATAAILQGPRLTGLITTLLVAVALGRLGQGAHLPHELLAGTAIGCTMVAAMVLVSASLAEDTPKATKGRSGRTASGGRRSTEVRD